MKTSQRQVTTAAITM